VYYSPENPREVELPFHLSLTKCTQKDIEEIVKLQNLSKNVRIVDVGNVDNIGKRLQDEDALEVTLLVLEAFESLYGVSLFFGSKRYTYWMDVSIEGEKKICDALRRHKELTSLAIDCKSRRTFEHFYKSLTQFTNLNYLRLKIDSKFETDPEIELLPPVIEQLPGLRFLWVDMTSISTFSQIYLDDYLPKNLLEVWNRRSINEDCAIRLDRNFYEFNLESEVFSALADGKSKITSFSISLRNFHEYAELFEALQGSINLEFLSIGFPKLQDGGLKEFHLRFSQFLDSLKSLQTLEFRLVSSNENSTEYSRLATSLCRIARVCTAPQMNLFSSLASQWNDSNSQTVFFKLPSMVDSERSTYFEQLQRSCSSVEVLHRKNQVLILDPELIELCSNDVRRINQRNRFNFMLFERLVLLREFLKLSSPMFDIQAAALVLGYLGRDQVDFLEAKSCSESFSGTRTGAVEMYNFQGE
jgi:hypothetical protein